jgi:CheY-like chemotaxis protein
MGSAQGTLTHTVMVVEDYEDARAAMKLVLELMGYRVLEAANGVEAVMLTDWDAPDLILMDLNMPVLDGFEATRRILVEHMIPIVAVSALSDSYSRQKATAAGVVDFVLKPVDFEHIERILDQYVPLTAPS